MRVRSTRARALPVAPSAGIASLCVALCLALALPALAQTQKGQTTGRYVDRTGKPHPWSVSAAHTLTWDGQPYVPIGGLFAPHYLAEGQTEENWKKDTDGLQVLQSKGILDLILNPTISAVDVPPAAWQRVIDYLDEKGFRYGILFGAGMTTPLSGMVIKPTRYRIEDIREGQGATWQDSDADWGHYIFVDGQDGTQVLDQGKARFRDGEVSVPPNQRFGPGTVGILYPHKALKPGRLGGLPDVWQGYDAYRDRLLSVFGQVKFGPGLRFFLDPLVHALNLFADETDYLVPDSPAFRLEWEAWLMQHYPAIDDLMNAWGLQDRDIKTFEQAAHVVPLSADGRGVPFLLDVESGKRMETRGGATRFWSDLRDCRNSSLVYYLNATADLLKHEIANVPVLYTRSHQYSIFTNQERSGGFDGLGIAAYGRGSSLVTSGVDSVFSQADASTRPMWCVVTETQDTASTAKADTGYASPQALAYDLDWLRNVGAKGFYVNGFQVLPEQTYSKFELLRSPEQIDWLKQYRDRLDRTVNVADVHTSTLLYPQCAAGYVHSGPIGGSRVWWAESLADGKLLQFGSSFQGYIIKLPGGEQTVLWSLRGRRMTHLLAGDPRKVQITTAEGVPLTPAKVDLKKKAIEIPIDGTPIVIKDNDVEVFPTEAADDALALLKYLVLQAENSKLGGAEEYKFQWDRAANMYRLRDARMAYTMAAEAINGIVNLVQPYTWLEAERAEAHTFSEISVNPAASGGAYLNLSTDSRPGPSGYGAEYKFSVPADDSYSVWLSCTPPGAQTSAFAWIVDANQKHAGSEGTVTGAPYLSNQFAWMDLGRVYLTKGAHTLILRVTEPTATGRYNFAADAILITRSAFTPNGIERPSLIAPAETPAPSKSPAKPKKTVGVKG